MTRRRYIQQKDGSLVEVSADYVPDYAPDAGALWGDRSYDGLRATDGADISTRTKHREYMRMHGLTTIDDYTQTWQKARAERDDFYTTGGDHRARREAVERALHETLNRSK